MKRLQLRLLVIGLLLLLTTGVCLATDDFDTFAYQEMADHELDNCDLMDYQGFSSDEVILKTQAILTGYIYSTNGDWIMFETQFINGSLEQEIYEEQHSADDPRVHIAVTYYQDPDPDKIDFGIDIGGISVEFPNDMDYAGMENSVKDAFDSLGYSNVEDWVIAIIMESEYIHVTEHRGL